MADSQTPFVAVRLPADLATRVDELKKDRDGDRDKSLEQLVREFCESYVRVREMARQEAAHMDDLNRSYEEQPDDYGDAEIWEEEYRRFLAEGKHEAR